MRSTTYPIAVAPYPLCDLDLSPFGEWVGVSAAGATQWLYIARSVLPVPELCAFPLVRAVGSEHVLLVDTRTTSRRANAWLIDAAGTVEAHFTVGDAVTDVVVFTQCFAVTYFDEAAASRSGFAGVVLFDFAGRPLYRHNERGSPWVLDCYCTCPLTRERLLFLVHPHFPVVVLDTTTLREETWETPRTIVGAHAVTVAGDTAFLHSPYKDADGIYRWPLGASDAVRVGDYAGRLRGLAGGTFLAVEAGRYTMVSLTDEL